MEETSCTLCLEQYELKKHEPVMLPCGHTFCRPCLVREERAAKRLSCPSCRYACSNTLALQLPMNFSMLTVSDYFRSHQVIITHLSFVLVRYIVSSKMFFNTLNLLLQQQCLQYKGNGTVCPFVIQCEAFIH